MTQHSAGQSGRLREVRHQDGRFAPADGVFMGQVPLQDAPDEIDLARMLRYLAGIACKWRVLILSTTLSFFALGFTYAHLATPLYSATVRIQIDREPVNVVDNESIIPAELGGQEFLKTQYELLKSRDLSDRVVAALKLDKTPEPPAPSPGLLRTLLGFVVPAPSQEQQDAAARASRASAISRVQNNVQISPVTGSRLVDIVFSNPSRSQAARIANAYAEAYVAFNLDRRFEANAFARAFLEDQIQQLKLKLEDSERAMIDFAERENMVQTNDTATIAETNLAQANSALNFMVANRIRDEQVWRQVEGSSGISLPQVLTNHIIEGLRTQRNELQRDYERNLEVFKPGYPAMIEIRNKIAEVNRQLAVEIAAVRKALKGAYETSLNQENEMRKRIDTLSIELLDLQKKSIRYGILEREVSTNRNIYNSLLQRYKEVDVASGVGANNVFIIDRALPPGAPSHPNVPLILALSLIAGLVTGFGGANLIELFDDRIETPEQGEKASGLPILGAVQLAGSHQDLLKELDRPGSQMAEAYRLLATSLQFATHDGLPSSLVITSSSADEGRSTIAIALARHFALTGLKVLLMDADLRQPKLHLAFGLQNDRGLGMVLSGNVALGDVIQKTDIGALYLVAPGPLPLHAGEILCGTHIVSVLERAEAMFDITIIDSPPLHGRADAQLLAGVGAATLFVMQAGETRIGMVRKALHRLRLVQAMPVGFALTKATSPASRGRSSRARHDRGRTGGTNRRQPVALAMQILERFRARITAAPSDLDRG